MKKILPFMFFVLTLPALSQDYMNIITDQACECLKNIPDTVDTERYSMELGLCIIQAAIPYQKQIKKDYNIDLDRIELYGEDLGRLIGMKMASQCPERLIKTAEKMNSSKTQTPEVADLKIIGVVKSIDNNMFVIFSVQDDTGKITKLYWLGFINSNIELTNNYSELVGKEVTFTYRTEDFFDQRIKEYRQFYIITGLQVNENIINKSLNDTGNIYGI